MYITFQYTMALLIKIKNKTNISLHVGILFLGSYYKYNIFIFNQIK